jgi:hypothetical protein
MIRQAPKTARVIRPAPTALPHPRQVASGVLAGRIDRVMAWLDSPGDQPVSGEELARGLRGALATIAACGATCYLRAATDQVRAAAVFLDAGAPAEARTLLARARAQLGTTQT